MKFVIQMFTVIPNPAVVATHVVPQVMNVNMESAASVSSAHKVLAGVVTASNVKNPFTTAYASVKFATS